MARDPKKCIINEQVIEDLVTGITLQFRVALDGTSSLLMVGDCLKFGNREFLFNIEGWKCGSETGLSICPSTSFIQSTRSTEKGDE